MQTTVTLRIRDVTPYVTPVRMVICHGFNTIMANHNVRMEEREERVVEVRVYDFRNALVVRNQVTDIVVPAHPVTEPAAPAGANVEQQPNVQQVAEGDDDQPMTEQTAPVMEDIGTLPVNPPPLPAVHLQAIANHALKAAVVCLGVGVCYMLWRDIKRGFASLYDRSLEVAQCTNAVDLASNRVDVSLETMLNRTGGGVVARFTLSLQRGFLLLKRRNLALQRTARDVLRYFTLYAAAPFVRRSIRRTGFVMARFAAGVGSVALLSRVQLATARSQHNITPPALVGLPGGVVSFSDPVQTWGLVRRDGPLWYSDKDGVNILTFSTPYRVMLAGDARAAHMRASNVVYATPTIQRVVWDQNSWLVLGPQTRADLETGINPEDAAGFLHYNRTRRDLYVCAELLDEIVETVVTQSTDMKQVTNRINRHMATRSSAVNLPPVVAGIVFRDTVTAAMIMAKDKTLRSAGDEVALNFPAFQDHVEGNAHTSTHHA